MARSGPGIDLSAMQVALWVKLKKNEFPYFVGMLYRAGVINYTHFLFPHWRVYETCWGVITIDEPIWLSGRSERKSLDVRAVYLLLSVNESEAGNFRQYIRALWDSGVSAYWVDVIARQVTYYGLRNEKVSLHGCIKGGFHRRYD